MKRNVLFILFVFGLNLQCSHKTDKYYDLNVIHTLEAYKQSVSNDGSKELLDLEKCIEGIVLDIRYATDNNFTGEVIYESAKAYVRKPVAEALKKVQQELNSQNLGLKVFDAYRPYAATLRFYEVYPDTNFVAAPWKGSRHNRACAVDITLVDMKTKKELPMPTKFDDFSEKANPSYQDLPDDVIENRKMLVEVMAKHGFSVYPSEWWHFDYHGWEDYELMDLSLSELENL